MNGRLPLSTCGSLVQDVRVHAIPRSITNTLEHASLMFMPTARPYVLALDLEGTLISNAVSQIPRPGLFSFLQLCSGLFPRVVMFTTVKEPRFRDVARLLVEANFAPHWFADIEYVNWTGPTKNLHFIANADPSSALLVDDFDRYVHPGQESQWIQVDCFGYPYSAEDIGLLKAGLILQARVRRSGVG